MYLNFKSLLSFLVLSIVVLQGVAQPMFTRQPYLNRVTQSGITIRFRSNIACVPTVKYGESLDGTFQAVTGASATEHELVLSDLKPFTKYYYQCACNNTPLTPINEDYSFRTLPAADYEGPLNFWVIGDFGQGNEGQVRTKEAYKNYMGATETNAWLWLGDNAYGDGTDQEYQDKVFNIYPELLSKMPLFPVPGNHDYKSVNNVTHDGPYYQIFTLPADGESGGRVSRTEKYYSYDIGNVHFVALNSEWSPWTFVPDLASIMINWLKLDLAQSDKKWKVVYWHQPPYTKGSHDSDDPLSIMQMMRQKVNKACEAGGVDLVLSGHSHCYERSYLINGHYQNSDQFSLVEHAVSALSGRLSENKPYYKLKDNDAKGTIYNVVGCSGSLSQSGTMDHPVMYYSDNTHYGSLALQVHGDTLLGKYLTAEGEILDDYAIVKSNQIPTGLDESVATNQMLPHDVRISRTQDENALFIEYDLPRPSTIDLLIYDLNGREVKQVIKAKQFNKGSRRQLVLLDFLPSGNYIATLIDGTTKVSKQFTK